MAEALIDSDGTVMQKCEPCLKKDIDNLADIYCVHCREFQCNTCSQGHGIYAVMREHKLVSVSEGQNYVSSVDGDGEEIKRYMCDAHDKRYEFYCKKDGVFLCSQCAIIGHKKCKGIIDIRKQDGHSECEKLKNELKEAICNTTNVTELLDTADARLSDDIQTLSDKLKDMKTRLIQIFDNFSKAILEQASIHSKTIKNDLTEKKDKCKEQIESLKKHLKTIEFIMNTGTPTEKFITERRIVTEFQQTMKDTTALEKQILRMESKFAFDEQLKWLKSELSSFQKSETLDISRQTILSSKLKLVRSIWLHQSGDDAKEPLYTGLDFLPDGRVVALDNGNKKCLIYDVNLNMKNSYKLSYPPLCVTAIINGEVVVTSGRNRLDFLNVSKTNDLTLDRTCKMNVEYHSISMMNDDNLLVGTIDHNKPFRIVSMSGGESDVDFNLPDKKYPLDTSCCTYIRGREKVVHCDRNNDKVTIYDMKSGKSVVVKDSSIKSPCGVAIGPYDHIFVCNNSIFQNSLVEITPCGRVLASHQVNMLGPFSIAISKDRKHLIVSNSVLDDRILSLYKIS